MPPEPGMPVISMPLLMTPEQLAGRQPGRNVLEVWRTGGSSLLRTSTQSMPGPPWHRTQPFWE
jgi:hypothetical protein